MLHTFTMSPHWHRAEGMECKASPQMKLREAPDQCAGHLPSIASISARVCTGLVREVHCWSTSCCMSVALTRTCACRGSKMGPLTSVGSPLRPVMRVGDKGNMARRRSFAVPAIPCAKDDVIPPVPVWPIWNEAS
jgi:hypothetical protein